MNPLPLADLHAIITGGGRGIGAEIADKLDPLGAKITLMGRTEETLQRKCAQLSHAQAVTVDVTDPMSVNAAFSSSQAQFGPVDILINNAGAAVSAPFRKIDNSSWSQMLAVNLTGVFYCCREALQSMQGRTWGRIINIASTAGLKGYEYVAAYCAAKHGAIGLTRALAAETAKSGITVNAICPGYTNTDMLADTVNNITKKTGMSQAQVEAQLKSINPQQRFIEPAEISATVAWLCLPGSESITGQAIVIAGGEIM